MDLSVPRVSGLFLLVVLVLATSLAFGQGIVTGSLSGVVQDQQKAVVSGATVTAKEVATNREFTGTTNEVGLFSIRALPLGTYNITITAPGFLKLSLRGVAVSAGVNTELGVQELRIGGTSETVEVEGSAPLVESNSAQISANFEAKAVTDLPLNNSFDALALFVPGIAPAGSAGMSNSNGADFAVNGQRGRSNNFQIDGQANNDNSVGGPSIFFGNQDAIAEVQVVTHYSAEYGRNMGSVVNYITKTGTNKLHGTAYWFNQNSLFDSFDNMEKSPLMGYCMSGQNPATDGCEEAKLPRMNDNRWGGTAGGPIKKDKLWYFASTNFETTRWGSSVADSSPYIMPTDAGLATLQTAFPNSPAVQYLKAYGPAAVPVGTTTFYDTVTQNVTANGVSVPVEFGKIRRVFSPLFNDYEATGKVDWQITQKDRFFGRYIFQQQANDLLSDTLANGAIFNVPGRDQQIGLDYTRTFTNNFLNQIRYSFGRVNFGWTGGAFPDCTYDKPQQCPTRVTFSAASGNLSLGPATNMPQHRIINMTQIQDNASWQIGRHTLKFGGEWNKQRSPNVFLPTGNGEFVFSSFDRFIANTPTRVNFTDGDFNINFRDQSGALYLQDDFRVRTNLTLNLGLRWEMYTQDINALHDLTVQRESNPATAFWDTTLPLNLRTVPEIPADKNNFSPVLGFAWTPNVAPALFGQGKTVIRGGFRIGYDPSFNNLFTNVYSSAPTVNSATCQAASDCNGFVPAMPTTGGFTGADIRTFMLPNVPHGLNPGIRNQTQVASNFHSPYSEQWNFGFERELTSKTAFEVRYVGNHTVGLFQSLNGNVALQPIIDAGFASVIPSGLTPCTDPTKLGSNLGYQDCDYRRVVRRANTAWSKYNGLQTRFDIRNWRGVTLNVGYTYSKTMDNASEVYSTLTGGSTLSFAQNPFNTNQAERGVSGIDYPHIFTITMMYNLPWYKSQQGLVGHVLGGWQMNTAYRYTSGQPWYPIQAREGGVCDPSGTMSGTWDACRPILWDKSAPLDSVAFYDSGSLYDYATGDVVPTSHWVVNDANAAAHFGTPYAGVSRNILRGDTISNVNFAVYKDTKLNERLKLQFQMMVFNLLNRQFRGVPDTIVDDTGDPTQGASFANTYYNYSGGDSSGATQSGIGRRRMQFGLKLVF
ncbi:MAG: TonB-dependent receptor domain-containing protein [Terriglobales bacterium]